MQYYHGNIMDSNHGNGTQPIKDFIVIKKHRLNPSSYSSFIYGESKML